MKRPVVLGGFLFGIAIAALGIAGWSWQLALVAIGLGIAGVFLRVEVKP